MSMRSAPLVDHGGIESGQDLTTWGTLRRGVELSPELRRGIGVTIALAILSTVGKVLVPFVNLLTMPTVGRRLRTLSRERNVVACSRSRMRVPS